LLSLLIQLKMWETKNSSRVKSNKFKSQKSKELK